MRACYLYARVSTDEQRVSGLGLEAQAAALAQWALSQNVTGVSLYDRCASARSLSRPSLQAALKALEGRTRPADGIAVARLDRLTRSTRDLETLLEHARRYRWRLVALDCQVDTADPAGALMLGMLGQFAQFERRLISARTKAALAAAKARGVKLGCPAHNAKRTPEKIRRRMLELQADGYGLHRIATWLNEHSIPTAFGGKRWYASSVRKVILRGT